MAIEPGKMSEILKKMSESVLRNPGHPASPEATVVALMFANFAWNETVGLVHDRQTYHPAWAKIEAENPQLWSELKSNDADALIDELVEFKKQNHPDDRRRILACGMLDGKVRVEWLPRAAPGVDSQWEMRLHGLVRTGKLKEAVRFLQETSGMSRDDAETKVAAIAATFGT
jgi:hypothetical protein